MNEKNLIINKLKEFNLIEKETDELYRIIATKHNLSESAFWILYEIRLNDYHLTQSELCKYSFLPKQTINSALKILEEQKFLNLIPSSENKKSKLIILTNKGIELSEKIIDNIIETEIDIFKSFDQNELEIFLKIHHEYAKNLKERIINKYEN